MKTIFKIAFLFFLSPATIACNDEKAETLSAIENLAFEKKSYDLSSGIPQRLLLHIKVQGFNEALYNNPLNPYSLLWEVADPSVATITQGGMVTPLKRGTTIVKVTTTHYAQPVTTIIRVDGGTDSSLANLVEALGAPLSDKLIYSRNVRLKNNSVMQSFDVTTNGRIFYVQIAGVNEHMLNVISATAAPSADKKQIASPLMTLTYFGHGTNIAIEEQGESSYIWIGSYGTKESATSNAYTNSQTIARIKFTPDSDCKPEQCSEHYYLPNVRHVHPAIDVENDLLALTSSNATSRRFTIYRLSEAKALTPTDVRLSERTYGGGYNDPTSSTTEQPTVRVHDLSKLTPLGDFTLKNGANSNEINYYDFQGFDVKGNRVFNYEGQSNGFNANERSNAYITVFDFNGRVVCDRTRVAITDDLPALRSFALTQIGALEAEGIKWHNGKLYIGFTARNASAGSDDRLQQILRYDCPME